ncbi:MAG: helix-hairpin-helix domain-containing protein [Bacteroidota bacterium]|nr:helix-hairpin-helix domain-containing protein [Bacteroidota bacterium]
MIFFNRITVSLFGFYYPIKKQLPLLFLLVFLFSTQSKAQKNPEIQIENIIENILEEANEEFDYSELQERLMRFYHSPLSLNDATKEELSQIFFLTDQQVNEIINYRKRYYGFTTIYELKSIQSLDPITLKRLLLFINTKKSEERKKLKPAQILKWGSNSILMKYQRTLEKAEGYLKDTSKTHYFGNPDKYYLRYNHNLGRKVSYGLTMEKDAGEEFFKGSQKNGFDYYSAHFYIGEQKHIKSLAIGDYNANFGQGLVFSSGFSLGKSTNAMNFFKYNDGISPYRSVNENNFLRGGAITYEFKNYRLTAFYSNKNIDGNIISESDSTDLSVEDHFTSFYTTGYHRTENEIEKKKSINEELFGTHLSCSFNKLNLGFTGVAGNFSNSLSLNEKPYNNFYFSGNEFMNFGADYSFVYNNLHFFGETGWDTKSIANISGLTINLGSSINAGLVYRNYPKNYNALYANAFREGSSTQNENGLYLALAIIPWRNWKINAYIDRFEFPWLKYMIDQPSKGFEYLTDIHYTPSYYTKMYWRIKYYNKEKNLSGNESVLNQISETKKLSFRYNIDQNISKQIKLKTRIEYSFFRINENEATQGFLSFQDIIWSSNNYKLRLIGRYSFFNIDDYYSRIYTYENDILYSFSIPSFFNKGMRYYLVARYNASNKITLWLKLSRTTYLDTENIGSGLNEIEGKNKTELRLMARIKF